jgi:hypothetical protein
MASKKSINALNPIVASDPVSTIEHCRDVLTWMEGVTDDASGCDFGRALVLKTINAALGHAEAQLKAKPTLEVVNG